MLSDTDHLFGTGCKDYRWVWKTFLRGHNVLYMDMWTVERDDARRERVRKAIGHTRRYAARMDFRAAVPRPDLASTGYCLAEPGESYLVYLPEGGEITVDLSALEGPVSVEWFSPASGETEIGVPVTGGGTRTFAPPFAGDAVLYLSKPNR